MTRRTAGWLVVALIAAGAGIAAICVCDGSRLPRARTQAELAALDDAAIENQVVVDLSRRIRGADGDPLAWRSFSGPARNIWVAAAVSQRLAHGGFRDEAPADEPGLAEAQEAFTALGLTEAAGIIGEARRSLESGKPPPPGLEGRLRSATGTPAATKLRAGYIRLHIQDIANAG